MRIAGGVLIIIAAIFDLIAGFGYTVGGGLVAGGGAGLEALAQQTADPKAKKELQSAAQKAGQAGAAVGGGLMLFGVFLLVMTGLGIAAGVVLFREKAPTFALIVGVLQLVAEVIGLIIFLGANILVTIPGILAGIFVILGAMSYRGKPAGASI